MSHIHNTTSGISHNKKPCFLIAAYDIRMAPSIKL
jgi:hypothetical protein